MRHLRILLPVAALLAVIGTAIAQVGVYVPQAQYCFPQAQAIASTSPLCAVIPGGISPDPMLAGTKQGYKGIIGGLPTGPSSDVESPFDNYSWQTFVGLNWKYTSSGAAPPANVGLSGTSGDRTWQNWSRVSAVFGNSPVQANCQVPQGYELFSMGSNGHGQPTSQNEEYIQAATLKPAIDVLGNFTLYERRVNNVEIAYLKAPGGAAQPTWNLTTFAGQQAFANGGGKVDFPATGATQNGAMEIKAAWRILDPKNHAANVLKYYVVRAVVAVAPDLVNRGPQTIVAPICTEVDLGLVAMHIIQKNPDSKNQLLPKWLWTTFEHVDNAPLATNACDITHPAACGMLNQTACPTAATGTNWSYYSPRMAAAQTNFPANGGSAFHWNGAAPYGKDYLQAVPGSTLKAGSQITRCFQIFKLTQQINQQWQAQLRTIGSVFANYMLIGTQWGASLEPAFPSEGPTDAAPNYLSNSVVETYLQTFFAPKGKAGPFTTGSCISCHTAATLTAGQNVSSNFSFLPGLVTPGLVRTLPPAAAYRRQ